MKRIFAHVLAGALLLTLAGAAQAQGLGQNNISIKVGGFFPSNGAATHSGGSTQLSAGLDYAVPATGNGATTSLPSIYADYNGGSKDGGHVDTYGIGFAVRTVPNLGPANKAGLAPYVGIGVGYYETQVKNTDVTPSVSGNKGNIGGKVFAGLDLTQSLFVEANYQLISSEKGVNPSGFGVQLGARF